MDMQGTSTRGSYQGAKNTSDPQSNNSIREGAGGVASDSLAAESYRSGGEFAQNRNAAPNSVSGSSATWNTTDTRNANHLDSTIDASSRDDDRSQKYPEALGGQGSFPGGHNADGYVGGPTGSSTYSSGNTGSYSGSGDGYSSNAGTAPSYTLPAQGAFQGGKPKGKNLTEGGFSGEGSNYSSGIGTRDDPGRAALQDFQKKDARADYGSMNDMGGPDRQQPYDSLNRNEDA